MKVLFYEDPVTDTSCFMWRTPHIALDARWLSALKYSDVDARMMTDVRFANFARDVGVSEDQLLLISGLEKCLWDPQVNINTAFQRHYERLTVGEPEGPDDYAPVRSTMMAMSVAVGQALKGFRPDIVVTWVPVPHLRALFPDAMILHKETSVFNRLPYPITYYLDPMGFGSHSYLARRSSACRIEDPAAIDAVEQIKSVLADRLQPFDRVLAMVPGLDPARPLLVSANQANGTYYYDAACTFRSQAEQVLAVLERAPRGYQILVTEHQDYRRLMPNEIDYLKARCPDVFFLPDSVARRQDVTQALVLGAQGIATVSSSVGAQALLWQRPLHALGYGQFNAFAATTPDGPAIWTGKETNTFDAAAGAWLVTRYSLIDAQMTRRDVLARRLEQMLAGWRARGADGVFETAFDAPAILTQEIDAHLAGLARDTLGRPLGGTRLADRVDMTRAAIFGVGWTEAHDHEIVGPYRWTTQSQAEILLPLEPGADRRVRIGVASAPLPGGLHVVLRAGTEVLGEVAIPDSGQERWLEATVPAPAIKNPATTLWLDCIASTLEAGQEPKFWLIISTISASSTAVRVSTPLKTPLHSVIIPVLNGAKTLAVTLPALLQACPEDCEIVIVDNQSTDNTRQIVDSNPNSRLRLISPPTQVDYDSTCGWGYAAARGTWLTHIGDDDLILASRFGIIEAVAELTGADMIFGSCIRYFWPGFHERHLAGHVDAGSFDDLLFVTDGPSTARRMIASSNVRHTGAVTVHKDLVQRVRNATGGNFMIAKLGEYAAFRTAAGLAQRVALINRPVVVIGRHSKSIGTALHHGEAISAPFGTNIEREVETRHPGTGYDFKGQQPYSLEAALFAARILRPYIGPTPIDWRRWRERMDAELEGRVARGVTSPEVAAVVRANAARFLEPLIERQATFSDPGGLPIAAKDRWGWDSAFYGPDKGLNSIEDVAKWFEASWAQQGKMPLRAFLPTQENAQFIDA